jgi:hypothetical protein
MNGSSFLIVAIPTLERGVGYLLFLLTRIKSRRGPEKTKPLKAICGIICFSK